MLDEPFSAESVSRCSVEAELIEAAEDSNDRSLGASVPDIFAAELVSALKALVGVRVAPMDRRSSARLEEINIRCSFAAL